VHAFYSERDAAGGDAAGDAEGDAAASRRASAAAQPPQRRERSAGGDIAL
jgi:hypothetical protein